MFYHGNRVSGQIQNNHMHVTYEDKKRRSQLSITINQQTRDSHILGPTKAQLILHELIPQIPLFWNYENCIHAY